MLEQVEVVLADWGSSIPLFRELSLSEHARKIVRHLIIPPQVAAVVQRDSEFPIVLAQNAALRRCRGQYLMQTDSDVLFPIEFLESFFELVLQRQSTVIVDPAKALIGVKRRHIPVQFTFSNPPVSELERFIREHPTACNLEVPEQFPFCATGMMVMHRDLWSEFRGYDERLIYWGWMEIDLGLRTSVKYPYYDLTDVHGMVLFHLEHYVDNGQGREVERKMNLSLIHI